MKFRGARIGFTSLVAAMACATVTAGEASAATCEYVGPTSGGSWDSDTNWSCGGSPKVPDAGDVVNIGTNGNGEQVNVTADAEALTLNLGATGFETPARLVFSNEAALDVTDLTLGSARIAGPGTLTVADEFQKPGDGAASVTNDGTFGESPDLVLDGPATHAGGTICVGRDGDGHPDQPSLQINDTYTIASTAPASVFPCTSGPRIHVNAPDGHLIKAGAGTASSGTGIDNDGRITVQAGTLKLEGGTGTETSDGAHVAEAGATLEFATNVAVGGAGRVGGAGTIAVSGLNLTVAAGATFDPTTLTLKTVGFLDLNGTGSVSLPALNLHGNGFLATLDSSRSFTVDQMNVTSGAIQGDFVLNVPSTGSFTKTTTDPFVVRNSGAQGSADLVLDVDVSWGGGTLCVGRDGDADPDQPSLQINKDFTIATGAPASVFPCTSGPRIHVNAPDGNLIKASSGTTSSGTGIDNDGRITVQAGTLKLDGGTGAETSHGAHVAEEGATLEFASNIAVGGSGRVGGDGTIAVSGLNLTVAAGVTFDPAVLALKTVGTLDLNGTTPVEVPELNLDGAGFLATLDSSRPIATDALNVTSGAIQGDFEMTVQAGGVFSKTTGDPFIVRNSGADGSPNLVLNGDASLDGGTMCVAGNAAVPDLPHVQINRDFTIGAGAAPSTFPCTPADALNPLIHVNGPAGHLRKSGPGTIASHQLIHVNGGTATIDSGQTLVFHNGLLVTDGLTQIASGGVLQGPVALVDGTPGGGPGGTLGGDGQVTGNVTNFSGTLRPGGSPGALTITGSYEQQASGTLRVDVDGAGQGTTYDHLDVGGAATLNGTLAVDQGVGFSPQFGDTFHFLTSGSRTGSFSTITGDALPGNKRYSLGYPGAPDFGARLEVVPTALSFTDTDPNSPTNDNNPRVKGVVPPEAVSVRVYKTADCTGPAVEIPASEFASPGAPVSVSDNSTTTFRGTYVDGLGNVSPCSSSSIIYVEDSTVDPPTFTDTDPNSPANDNNPRIKGTTPPDAVSVRVYKSADCTGPAVQVSASDFASPGAPVTVPDNSTTTFHGIAIDGSGNESACSSSSITYVEDSPPAGPPTFTDTDPDSPANDNSPRIKGTAPAGAVTVRVYKTANCSGPAVQVSAADFASPGAPVSVPDNSTTTFHGVTVDAVGNESACSSSSITYVEDSRVAPPTFTDTDPDSPANDTNPRIKGTAPPGAVSVRVYKTADCTGPAVQIPASDFASPGAPVNVPDESTTTFHGTAVDSFGTESRCSSSSITYVERSPRISIDDISVPEGDGGGANTAAFNITLSEPAPQPGVSVRIITEDGTATERVDYQGRNLVLTFDPGESSIQLPAGIFGDRAEEPDETFFANLSNPTNGAVIADGRAQVTIRDDDAPDGPRISVDDVEVAEGDGREADDDVVFTLSLDRAPQFRGMQVDAKTVDGTAEANVDYVPRDTTVVFSQGDPTATLNVQVNGDLQNEADETFALNLSNPTGSDEPVLADERGIATIRDDDAGVPEVSVGDVELPEGNSGTKAFSFPVSLDKPAPPGGVTVGLVTADAMAREPGDYLAKSGAIEFVEGQKHANFVVPVKGDGATENDEVFFVRVTAVAGARRADSEGKGLIGNDDGKPKVSIEGPVAGAEGDIGRAVFKFPVVLDRPAPKAGVEVEFETRHDFGGERGSAEASDFDRVAGTLDFGKGEDRRVVKVPVIGDPDPEPHERFKVELSKARGGSVSTASAIGTIENDDAPRAPDSKLSIGSASAPEGDEGETPFSFEVRLDGPAPAGGVVVEYSTVAKTAEPGEDYTEAKGTASIPPGERAVDIVVPVHGDQSRESSEEFLVKLISAEGANLSSLRVASGLILDDDGEPGAPKLSLGGAGKDEGNSGETPFAFPVRLDREAPPGGVTVGLRAIKAPTSLTARPGDDFVAREETLFIPEGQRGTQFVVPVLGDRTHENDELFNVEVTQVVGADPGRETIAEGLIRDDDPR